MLKPLLDAAAQVLVYRESKEDEPTMSEIGLVPGRLNMDIDNEHAEVRAMREHLQILKPGVFELLHPGACIEGYFHYWDRKQTFIRKLVQSEAGAFNHYSDPGDCAMFFAEGSFPLQVLMQVFDFTGIYNKNAGLDKKLPSKASRYLQAQPKGVVVALRSVQTPFAPLLYAHGDTMLKIMHYLSYYSRAAIQAKWFSESTVLPMTEDDLPWAVQEQSWVRGRDKAVADMAKARPRALVPESVYHLDWKTLLWTRPGP